MKLIYALAFSVFFISYRASGSVENQVIESKLEQPFGQKQKLFGHLTLNHFTNNYYDNEGYLQKQAPSMETKARVGLRYYRGKFEVFGEAGIVKFPGSQQVLESRPSVGAFYYPLFGPWGELLVYNINDLPHSTKGSDREQLAQYQGTVSTFGVAPQIVFETVAHGWPIGLRIGADVKSKVYSRKQTVSPDEQINGSDLSLVKAVEVEDLEDGSSRLWHQSKMGVYFSPSIRRSFVGDLTAFTTTEHYPFYFSEESGQINSRYKFRRTARVRMRTTLKLTPQLFLRNDLVKFFDGVFERTVSSPRERLRNTFQVGFKF